VPDSMLSAAVRANADWCDLMCQAHGAAGEFAEDAWTSPVRTPMFYPDAVALVPGPLDVLDRVDASAGCSVKDSFVTLDLPGFSTLFEATWIARPPGSAPAPSAFDWRLVGSPNELAAFDTAFGGPDLFVPALLQRPQIAVFAGWRGGRVAAGAVVNVSGPVLGLSNVFGPEGETRSVWVDVVGAVTARFSDTPITGYERGLDLEAAMNCDFRPLGELRVLHR
jgi:hypothetical protein